MNAAILRQAAEEMRSDAVDDYDISNEAFWLAVADWLDACALVAEVKADAVKAHALNVARAYLGSESS